MRGSRVVSCAATTMLMGDGLVAVMTLVVGSCSGVFGGRSRWSSPTVKSEPRLRLDLWRRCPVAGGPLVMVFFGASLAYIYISPLRSSLSESELPEESSI
jgi:hypothetical protein